MFPRFGLAMGALTPALSLVFTTSALAAAPTITSPTPGQAYTDPADISYAGTWDSSNSDRQFTQIAVTVKGPDEFSNETSPDPDGTWTLQRAPNPDMPNGSYSVTACQADECSPPVMFTFGRGSGGAAPEQTPAAVHGSFRDLWRHKLTVSVTCAQECDYQGTLNVSASAAARFLMTTPVIGRFSRVGAPAGTSTTIVGAALSPLLQAWPLLSGAVPVTVRLDGSSTSAGGSLGWPRVASDKGGKGHGLIRRIKGPRSVSLATRTVTYRVRLGGLPGTRYVVADIDTPDNYLFSPAKWYMGDHIATGADFRRGGTFKLKIPIAAAPRGLAKARQFAPVAAEVLVGILNKHDRHDRAGQDQSHYFIELTK